MKTLPVLTALIVGAAALPAEPFREARVTRVVNQVDLLRPEKKPSPATVGALVNGRTAVRTGADSRTELRFPDDSLTRLGANALFRFETGTREMTLEQGTILFSPAKGTGGGEVQMGAVTAAVAGTTFLGSHLPKQQIKVIVLEGKVRVKWKGFFLGSRVLSPGEMFELALDQPDAKGRVTRLELRNLLATSRLLESGGFAELPKMDAVLAAAGRQRPFLQRITNPPLAGTEQAQTARRIETVNRPDRRPDPVPRPGPNIRPQERPKPPKPVRFPFGPKPTPYPDY